MTDTKLTVKFLIPGGKPYTKRQCKEGELPNAHLNVHTIKVQNDFKGNKRRHGGKELRQTEYIHYATCSDIPAVQVINMSHEAYKAMLDIPPMGYREFGWNRLYENAKLKAHLDVLKYDLHAYGYEFYVYPD